MVHDLSEPCGSARTHGKETALGRRGAPRHALRRYEVTHHLTQQVADGCVTPACDTSDGFSQARPPIPLEPHGERRLVARNDSNRHTRCVRCSAAMAACVAPASEHHTSPAVRYCSRRPLTCLAVVRRGCAGISPLAGHDVWGYSRRTQARRYRPPRLTSMLTARTGVPRQPPLTEPPSRRMIVDQSRVHRGIARPN